MSLAGAPCLPGPAPSSPPPCPGMAANLAQAIAAGEFRLVFQPIFNLVRGAVVGCEALLRWRHASGQDIPPSRFIPVAEAAGLMPRIGAWALEQACLAALAWPAGIWVSVNVSPAQFLDTALRTRIDRILARTGLPAHRLKLEVTESLVIHDVAEVRPLMRGLRDRGANIWLDDFGTGHATLAALRRLPFDGIKLDRSAIAGLDHDPLSRATLRTSLGIARARALSVVVEGVERPAQLDILRQEGCRKGQGFLLARPMEADAARRWLQHPGDLTTPAGQNL